MCKVIRSQDVVSEYRVIPKFCFTKVLKVHPIAYVVRTDSIVDREQELRRLSDAMQ
jgi:hypothetical protein